MKKRYLSLFLIIILISSIVSAVIPYKQSLTINNYKIKQVECSNNYLRVLVESKTSSNLYILFKISTKDKKTNNIFTNTLLNKFESDWFLINTNELCNNLKRLEVNGYLTTEDTIIYLNSESSYIFLGKEQSITTITQEALTQTTTQETTQVTTTKYSYVYLNNKLLERINLDNNDVNYFHQDHLGSNRVITDNNGNILSKNEYTPFGNELSFSSKSNYKFTGKEQDKTNLYYFGARYYDSSIGRFTQVDPSFESTETPYSYVDNNPVRYIDKRGEQAENVYASVLSSRAALERITPEETLQILRKSEFLRVLPTSHKGDEFIVYNKFRNPLLDYRGNPLTVSTDPEKFGQNKRTIFRIVGEFHEDVLSSIKKEESLRKAGRSSRNPPYGAGSHSPKLTYRQLKQMLLESARSTNTPITQETLAEINRMKEIIKRSGGPALGVVGLTITASDIAQAAESGGVHAGASETIRQTDMAAFSVIGGSIGSIGGPLGICIGVCAGGYLGDVYFNYWNSLIQNINKKK